MKCNICGKEIDTNEVYSDWFYCKFCQQTFNNQPERSKREDEYFVIKGSSECIALDAIPSKECKEYHENSYIQINKDNNTYSMRCSEHCSNAVRDK